MKPSRSAVRFAAAALVVASLAPLARAEAGGDAIVPFTPERWSLEGAQVVDHLGRRALAGAALLKDAVFEDGVIDVDVAVSGERSYPGVLFRIASPGNHERVYLRPHRSTAARYPDVVQYVPGFNGIDSWQLHNGGGYTSYAEVPTNAWVHVRIEVRGTQARVFVGDPTRPALEIHELGRGASRGGLGLLGPPDGSAYFSNFSFRAVPDLRFDAPPPSWPTPGAVVEWRLSPPRKARSIDPERPLDGTAGAEEWTPFAARPDGLVDVSRRFGRLGGEPDAIAARTTLRAAADEVRRYRFGYSDEIRVYLNGRLLYEGESGYTQRDPSFLGIVGPYDSLYLPLAKGDNELLAVVTERMGGWGFEFVDATARFAAPGVERAWDVPRELSLPESAAYDPVRKSIYVSNWDGYNPSRGEPRQFLSRLSPDGKIESLRWVEGLRNPGGIAVRGDTLVAVEAGGLAEIDIPSAAIRRRIPIPGSAGLNDVAIGAGGAVFVSDSRKDTIFRVEEGKAEAWLSGPDVARPNGLLVAGGELYVGVNGDGRLKAVDLKTKAIRVVASLGQGIIDGIQPDGAGSLLVTHNEGRLFKVSPDGKVTLLLDGTTVQESLADIGYVPERRLVVAPTFAGNGVVAYRVP